MNIDWSEAPDGAEAGHSGDEGLYAAWYRKDVAGLVLQICPGAGIHTWTWMGCRRDFPVGSELRPFSNTKWTGEGPPPIGKATCEYLGAHNFDQWKVVNIFAYWGKDVFVDYGDGWRAERDLARFRPIRTPEQIAAEAREKAIQEIFRVITSADNDARGQPSFSNMAEALHDAGFAKFEIVDEDRA